MTVKNLDDIELSRIKCFTTGIQNHNVFHAMNHARGGTSHHWKGPSVYMPYPFARYTHLDEYGSKHERIQFRNNFWWRYNPPEPKIYHCHNPLMQEWHGRPMFYSAYHDKLLNEHTVTHIPRDARLFYNEEDWLKYNEMVKHPQISKFGYDIVRNTRNPNWRPKPTKKQFPEVKMSSTKLYSGK